MCVWRSRRLDTANFHVAVFAVLGVEADRSSAYEHMAPWLAGLLDGPTAGLLAVPFFDDLVALYRSGGLEGLVTMPSDWWTELGPIGTLDDAQTHIESLEAAGARSIGLFPTPDATLVTAQLPTILRLADR